MRVRYEQAVSGPKEDAANACWYAVSESEEGVCGSGPAAGDALEQRRGAAPNPPVVVHRAVPFARAQWVAALGLPRQLCGGEGGSEAEL